MTHEEFADLLREMGADMASSIARLNARVADAEAKAAAAVARLDALQLQAGPPGPPGTPGPAGAHGERGIDGRDGRDGKDGYASVEDMRAAVRQATAAEGTAIRVELRADLAEAVAGMPLREIKGAWEAGTEYRKGDCVLHNGSTWHASMTTREKPGDGKTAWLLIAKRGRDGKDFALR